MKITNYTGMAVLGLSLWGLSCATVTLAQGEKKAAHYALENYAVYANSPMSAEEQRGYREGFTQGQKQAKTNIGPNPLKTKYYHAGSTRYREAFLQGYLAGYHQKMNRRQMEREQRQDYYPIDHTGNIANDGFIYRDYGYYDNGYNKPDFQKGYRDGLSRGRDNARTNRAMDPNNSSHYRKGNADYRSGFEHGFYQSFRRYRGY